MGDFRSVCYEFLVTLTQFFGWRHILHSTPNCCNHIVDIPTSSYFCMSNKRLQRGTIDQNGVNHRGIWYPPL